MFSDYVCINEKTFEIEEIKGIISRKSLGKTISILNKKGYYTDIFDKASIFKPFLISDLIVNLIKEDLLKINSDTKDKLKKIINHDDYESTMIVFKDKYKFESLPEGFKMIDNRLYYNLKILKGDNDINFKSLVELDKENNKSLKALEEWANKLPNKN